MKTPLTFALLLSSLPASYAQTFSCGDSLYDPRDGQYYATVQIGSDCWFQQNLNYGTYVQSDSMGVIHSQQTNNGVPEKYAQDNNPNNLLIYGGLYEQSELMNYSSDPQGLCPDGWHVSTDAEWQTLITAAGGSLVNGTGGTALKAIGTGLGLGAGTDQVGIALLPGGDRDGFGIFYGLGLRYIYWTSTASGPNQAYHYTLWAENDTIERLSLGVVTTGFSCRCVQDAPSGLNEQGGIHIEIYPNPTNTTLQLKTSEVLTEVRITNCLGALHMQKELEETNESVALDVAHLPAGSYLLYLKTESETWLAPKAFVKL